MPHDHDHDHDYDYYISWIYRTYKRCVTKIIQQDICVPLRYLADISFLRYTAAAIYRSCDIPLQRYIVLAIYHCSDISFLRYITAAIYLSFDISLQRYIVQHTTDSLQYFALATYHHNDIL